MSRRRIDFAAGFPRAPKDHAEEEARSREGVTASRDTCPTYSAHDWKCSFLPGHGGDHIASDGYEILDRWPNEVRP